MGKIDPKDLVLAVQSPKEAVYGLFLGDETNKTFNPDKLTIIDMANGYCEINDLNYEVAIIGESHFVRVRRDTDGRVLFTELLACVDPVSLGFEPNILNRLSQRDGFHIKAENEDLGLVIDVRAQIQPKTKDRRNFVPKTLLDADEILSSARLKREFPGPLKPRTIVAVMLYPDHLDIRTVHEYVTEDKFIEPLTSKTTIFFRP